MKGILTILLISASLLTIVQPASADIRYWYDENGRRQWEFDPDYKDPSIHIKCKTKNCAGELYFTPEQRAQRDFEINMRRYQEEKNGQPITYGLHDDMP